MSKIEITDEMVERFQAELGKPKWINAWATNQAVKAALDAALNSPGITVTSAMQDAGLSFFWGNRKSHDNWLPHEREQITRAYRAMAALAPMPEVNNVAVGEALKEWFCVTKCNWNNSDYRLMHKAILAALPIILGHKPKSLPDENHSVLGKGRDGAYAPEAIKRLPWFSRMNSPHAIVPTDDPRTKIRRVHAPYQYRHADDGLEFLLWNDHDWRTNRRKPLDNCGRRSTDKKRT